MFVMNGSLHIDCHNRFHVSQTKSMFHVANLGLQIYSLHLQIFENHSQLLYLWREFLYCSVTFSQFVPGEFVYSHFLSSSILPLHECFWVWVSRSTRSRWANSSWSLTCPFRGTIDFQTIGIKLSLIDHDKSCRENLLYILAFVLQILPLWPHNLYFLQQMISSIFRLENLNRGSLFLTICWCSKERSSWSEVLLDSTFFCLKTAQRVSPYSPSLRVSPCSLESEMNLTLSFHLRSDTLVIGQYLLFSPVSAVVKSVWSVFAHRPNQIQEGGRDAFSRIISRCHTRTLEEWRFYLHRIVLFCKIFGLIICRRVQMQHFEKHFYWIVAVVNLVRRWNLQRSRWWFDRRTDWSASKKWGSAQWWRNHHRRDVVCHASPSVKINVFVRTQCSICKSRVVTRLESWVTCHTCEKRWKVLTRLTKNTTREKSRVRERDIACGFEILCTSSVAWKRNVIDCKRKHLESVKKIIAHSMMKISIMKLFVNLGMKNVLMDGRVFSNPFVSRHAQNLFRSS